MGMTESQFMRALFEHGLPEYQRPMRYIVLMDGPRAEGGVLEIEEGDQNEEGFWQDVEQGRYTAKLMPRNTKRRQADAELMDWEVSLAVERFLAGEDDDA